MNVEKLSLSAGANVALPEGVSDTDGALVVREDRVMLSTESGYEEVPDWEPPEPGTVTFNSPGEHTFEVPHGVTTIKYEVRGAGGGGGPASRNRYRGGNGALRTGTLAVVPGQTLVATVGVGGSPGRKWFSGSTAQYSSGTKGGDSSLKGVASAAGGYGGRWNGRGSNAVPEGGASGGSATQKGSNGSVVISWGQ